MAKATQSGLRLPALFAVVSMTALLCSSADVSAQQQATIQDREFWRLITDLSEPGGRFPQQFMSNEDSAQFVIPFLRVMTRPGGIYVGVGSEQNFTYIAAVEPRLAFIVDIRRDNMLEHLMYKALFELSDNRADFISRLFSRKRPAGVDTTKGVKPLFESYRSVDPDPAYYQANVRAVLDRLTKNHGFSLTDADRQSITQALDAFRTAGPFSLKGFGDTTNPTYAEMMSETDLDGLAQSYLASENNFRIVRELERQNRIIPVVGDFAGNKAIPGIAQYLRGRGATVNTFYVSNVERYLFEQGEHGRQFYSNAATLPADASSTIIRSVTSDISRRLGIPIPDGPAKWRTFLYSMEESLKGVNTGRVQDYAQLFQIGLRQAPSGREER